MKNITIIILLLLTSKGLFAYPPYSLTLMTIPNSSIPTFITTNMSTLNMSANKINVFNKLNTEPQVKRKKDNLKDIVNLENEIEVELRNIVFNQKIINNIGKLK